MDLLTNLEFNPKESTIMHIDLNSCFATIEQQANSHLRGKPIAVAAYNSPRGCIVAPSIEAKRYGIRVGMQVQEGKMLYPDLIVLEPDPWKYRNVHMKLKGLLQRYSHDVFPKSIDEFILDIEGYPSQKTGIHNVAKEIKEKIKKDIGSWLTVSIGISTNRFLAKLGANLKKPDGLEEININNYTEIYKKVELADLHGIATNNSIRLQKAGLYSVIDMYNASPIKLKQAFRSIIGYYWYLRLRGWEIDDVEFGRKSFGNSFALPKQLTTPEELAPILTKLVLKMTTRMRKAGYKTQGVHVSVLYRNGNHWHRGMKTQVPHTFFGDIYKIAYKILRSSPYRHPVHTLAVSCFNLTSGSNSQLHLYDDLNKTERLAGAVDYINERFGNFVITPAKMLGMGESAVQDRISFGGVKELESMVLGR